MNECPASSGDDVLRSIVVVVFLTGVHFSRGGGALIIGDNAETSIALLPPPALETVFVCFVKYLELIPESSFSMEVFLGAFGLGFEEVVAVVADGLTDFLRDLGFGGSARKGGLSSSLSGISYTSSKGGLVE